MAEDDLSVWNQYSETRYFSQTNWWSYWLVFRSSGDGLWYWWWVDEDGWDGEQTVEEIIDSSGRGFSTWQEAALDAQEASSFFD